MTYLLEQAVETARALPDDMQDEIARIVLMLAGTDQPVVQLTSDEEASFAVSLEQARQREFASDEQVQAVWSKHQL
jgi:hypothetical protein